MVSPSGNPRKNATRSAYSVCKDNWRVSGIIVGFYVLGMACPAAHYYLFTYLNGRIISSESDSLLFEFTNIPQSYVTTISLVLVTAFRATIVACIGLCYTQYLWKVLRTNSHKVETIEDMFQIRLNPFHLLNPVILRQTPILALLATYSWLCPITMIYPSGCLIVDSEVRQIDRIFNVSLFQSNSTLEDYYHDEKDVSNTWTAKSGLALVAGTFPEGKSIAPTCRVGDTCQYIGPISELVDLANNIFISRRSLEIYQPPGANTSYSLNFKGPKLECQQKNMANYTQLQFTSLIDHGSEGHSANQLELVSPIERFSLSYGYYEDNVALILKGLLNNNALDPPRIYPCIPHNYTNLEYKIQQTKLTNMTLIQPMVEQRCTPRVVEYTVNVTSMDGTQRLEYTTANASLFDYTQQNETFGKHGHDSHISKEESFRIQALFDALLSNFHSDTSRWNLDSLHVLGDGLLAEDYKLPDGSTVQACTVGTTQTYGTIDERVSYPFYYTGKSHYYVSQHLMFSVFYQGDGVNFDPAIDFVVTEDLINDLLANGGANVQFIVLGFVALQENGYAAIDGGFIQILMTTTGRTSLEAAALKGCLGGQENIPEELKKLKVRFGELLLHEEDDDAIRGPGDGHCRCSRSPAIHADYEKAAEQDDECMHIVSRWSSDTGVIRSTDSSIDRTTGHPPGDIIDGCTLASTRELVDMVGADVAKIRIESLADDVTVTDIPASRTVHRRIRRAGFGTMEETKPLEKGVKYGS